MQQKEIVLLIQWLREHGHSSDEIIDCIEFIESGRKEN